MSKPPARLPVDPQEFSRVEAPSQTARSALSDASPQSSTAKPQRGAIDSLVQASLVELFQAYGIAVAPLPKSARERQPTLPDVSAMIGFTTDARRSGRPFVMIILDVNMPRMNGLEMLDQLRLDTTLAKIPVVLLTTEAEPSMIDRARKAGAKGWLIKPVPMDHIVSTVKALTRRDRA